MHAMPDHAKDALRNAPDNYEKYFVSAIGAPLASDLVAAAGLSAGDHVLDVACGTGVVARLAAQRVGAGGRVAGLDVNPGMLGVARRVSDTSIDWYETSAEAIPLPDESFDVALCQMGLQFFSQKLQALREIRRVLRPGGRLVLNVPGPTPALFRDMAEALSKHVGAECAAFVHVVFSLHDAAELRGLLTDAGFREVDVRVAEKVLSLPEPRDFLWQYVESTPLAGMVAAATEAQRNMLASDVARRWQEHVSDGTLKLQVTITTVVGR